LLSDGWRIVLVEEQTSGADKLSTPLTSGITTISLVVAALSLAALTWHSVSGAGDYRPGKVGALYSVQLTSGQIFYGRLEDFGRGYVRMGQLYYVPVLPPDPKTGQRPNTLASQRKSDWHAPDWSVIPIDKIVMMEAVGADSQVAKLIAQDTP